MLSGVCYFQFDEAPAPHRDLCVIFFTFFRKWVGSGRVISKHLTRSKRAVFVDKELKNLVDPLDLEAFYFCSGKHHVHRFRWIVRCKGAACLFAAIDGG